MSDGNHQKDSSNDIIYVLLAIVLLVVGIWWLFGDGIKYWYLTVKLWQTEFINAVYSTESSKEIINAIKTKPASGWSLGKLAIVGDFVGNIVNVFYAVIVAYLSYVVWSGNPSKKFNRVFTTQTLKESEQVLYPFIAPAINPTLINEPLESGKFAMGIKPYDFAVKYKLLLKNDDPKTIDETRTTKLFASQLGEVWNGFDNLRPHEKAMFGVMIACICDDKKSAMAAINEMAISSTTAGSKMPEMGLAISLLKYKNEEKVLKAIENSAFVYTAFIQLVALARKSVGVLPSSYFTWLKPRDRTLWYVLNGAGRQVSWVETAGIYAHWAAEVAGKRKIFVPCVAEATTGLIKALSETKLVVE